MKAGWRYTKFSVTEKFPKSALASGPANRRVKRMKINLEFVRETTQARLFRRRSGREIWIPRSVIMHASKPPRELLKPWVWTLEVENWWAEKNEL